MASRALSRKLMYGLSLLGMDSSWYEARQDYKTTRSARSPAGSGRGVADGSIQVEEATHLGQTPAFGALAQHVIDAVTFGPVEHAQRAVGTPEVGPFASGRRANVAQAGGTQALGKRRGPDLLRALRSVKRRRVADCARYGGKQGVQV